MSPEQYRRVKQVFQEAADLPREARDGFVERTCGDDPDVVREVVSLLEHHEPAVGGADAAAPRVGVASRAFVDSTHTLRGRSGR